MPRPTRSPAGTPVAGPGEWISPDEAAGLDDFWHVYREAYDDLGERALAAALEDPHFGPILRAMPAEQLAEQRRDGRRRFDRAMDGDWTEYEANLRHQGALYAKLGVSYSAWYRLVQAAVRGLTPLLIDAYGSERERLCRALLAMDGYTDWVMAVIGEAYLETRQELVTAEQAQRAAIVDAALDAIVTMDREGLITELNPAAVATFGYSREEAVGQPLADLIIPEPQREAHRAGLARYLETGESRVIGRRLELRALRKDGTELPVELTVTRLPGDGPPVFTGFVRDQSELERRARELERSNAELEQFAYVASHDLQEPLRMVANYTELLANRYRGQLDEKADKYIHYASDGARRMQRLVRDLLTYSRVASQGKPLEPVDAGAVAEHVVRLLGQVVQETRASIELGSLPTVMADEGQLRQLLQNLIGNALKFRSEEPPRVSVEATRQGAQWRFTVADNGIGMEMKYAGRIFQMFQRLHAVGQYDGSGIGLAVSKRIVERHGGKIWVDSKPDAGTAFHFTLPAVTR